MYSNHAEYCAKSKFFLPVPHSIHFVYDPDKEGFFEIISFWRQIHYKSKGLGAWTIFDEMKGLSGFQCLFLIFSNVPSGEQGGEFIGNTKRN